MEKKYYVYALLDSRKPGYWCYQIENHEIEFEYEPFYIGKGCGSRLTTHLKETINNPELKTRKHQKIRSILKTGTIIPKKIVLNLNNKDDALSFGAFHSVFKSNEDDMKLLSLVSKA